MFKYSLPVLICQPKFTLVGKVSLTCAAESDLVVFENHLIRIVKMLNVIQEGALYIVLKFIHSISVHC